MTYSEEMEVLERRRKGFQECTDLYNQSTLLYDDSSKNSLNSIVSLVVGFAIYLHLPVAIFEKGYIISLIIVSLDFCVSLFWFYKSTVFLVKANKKRREASELMRLLKNTNV